MACDEDLAHRVREQLANEDVIAEKPTAGRLASRLGARDARGARFAGSLPPER